MDNKSITINEATDIIWKANDNCRGLLSTDNFFEVILEVMLWAVCVPTSSKDVIGYFDAMDSVKDKNSWNAIQKTIDIQCNRSEEIDGLQANFSIQDIEKLRSYLLPLARVLANGSNADRKTIVEALLSSTEGQNRSIGFFGCSYSMGLLWRELIKDEGKGPIACLFSMGCGAAPFLEDKQVQFYSINIGQDRRLKGILRLLNREKQAELITSEGGWTTAIASPAWGEKGRDLLKIDPWLAGATLDCPDSIRNTEARRIYSAHQLCTGKTFALVPPSLGFSGINDIEYFRSEIIKNNWLDAIVELPSGCISGARVGGLLLILCHDRDKNRPITVISAEKLLLKSNKRAGRDEWDQQGINELIELLKHPRESDFCKLATKADLEANRYVFAANKYLKSDVDEAIEDYIKTRKTLILNDLAEIKRPIAALGKRSDEGIAVKEITLGDIGDAGVLTEGSKVIHLEESVLSKVRDQLLEEGDVLLSIKGGIGKVAAVGQLAEQTIPGQAFCVVRLRANAPLSPDALVQYLRSDIGQFLLQKASQGSAVAFVPMGDLKSIPIVIPTQEEKQRSIQVLATSKELSQELEQLTVKLNQLSCNGWLEGAPSFLHKGAP